MPPIVTSLVTLAYSCCIISNKMVSKNSKKYQEAQSSYWFYCAWCTLRHDIDIRMSRKTNQRHLHPCLEMMGENNYEPGHCVLWTSTQRFTLTIHAVDLYFIQSDIMFGYRIGCGLNPIIEWSPISLWHILHAWLTQIHLLSHPHMGPIITAYATSSESPLGSQVNILFFTPSSTTTSIKAHSFEINPIDYYWISLYSLSFPLILGAFTMPILTTQST